MKTNLLLAGVALGLAVASASAADAVYSSNVVGYVNLDLVAGWNMVANPLDSGDNMLSKLVTGVPEGTAAYKLVNGSYVIATYEYDDIEEAYMWSKDFALNPGEAMFLNLPSAATVTFVGEVVAGVHSVALNAGWNMVSSPTPVAGNQDEIGLSEVVEDGDALYAFNAATQGYTIATYEYDDIEETYMWSKEINIAVGTGFFLSKKSPALWIRNFEIK